MVQLEKSVVSLKLNRSISLLRKILSYIIRKLRLVDPADFIYQRRLELSQELNTLHKSKVAYGPLTGLKLTNDEWWGSTSRASMLLGFYEKEVLDSLGDIPSKYSIFVDVGAADGYYGVGLVVAEFFQNSICYEIAQKGQEAIRKNALLNNVSERVTIRGAVEKEFYKDFSGDELKRSVFFFDIEGVEFDILNRDSLLELKDAIIFIESHALFFKDGKDKEKNLIKLAKEFFEVSIITTCSRDLSGFKELSHYSDTDRWLICSEGRGELMNWLRLDPKN